MVSGWMAEEEDRQASPLMTKERWDSILRHTGFNGLDLAVPDTPDVMTHQGMTMISEAAEIQQTSDTESATAVTKIHRSEDVVIVKTNLVESASDTIGNRERSFLNKEYNQLVEEVDKPTHPLLK